MRVYSFSVGAICSIALVFGTTAGAADKPVSPDQSLSAKAGEPFSTVSKEYIVTKVALKVSQIANRAMGNEPPVMGVPEPSTYAFALIATGVMAAVVRRRKAKLA